MSSNIRIKRKCQHCSELFIAKTTVTKYCGDNCAKRAYKARKRKKKIQEAEENLTNELIAPLELLRAKEFLTVKEACTLLGLSRTTLWRLINDQKIKALRLGRRKLILKKSINDLYDTDLSMPTKALDKETKIDKLNSYTINEVLKKYPISEKALYEVIKRESFRKKQIGRNVYVLKESIDKIFNPI